jgi:tetratricopeptide (TPR) repeat protein
MYQVGHNLQERGLYTEAEPLLHAVLHRYTTLHGTHHAEVIKTLNQLSLLYMEMGKDAQADDFYQQARIQQEQVLDPTSLQRLMPHVFDLVEQGKADQAVHVCQNMLMDEAWLQRQDPLLEANIHYLLAGLYTYQEKKELADIHYQRTLAMQTTMLGADHPLNGKLLMDMAHYYLYLGEIAQAKVYITQALEILLKTLGPDHLEIATAQEILADIFVKMGEYAKAEQLYQQVLEIRKHKKVSYDTDII